MPRGVYKSDNRKGMFEKGHKVNRKYKYSEDITPQQAFYRRNSEILKEKAKNKLREIRIIALKHYSGETPFCACCGEKQIEFLCFDHINGGGTKHRKQHGGNFGYWLVKNNFPEDIQILCHNCNMAKGANGICPHKKY